MRCQAWVARSTSADGNHREIDQLLVASADDRGHNFSAEEADIIKSRKKLPKGVRLGKPKRCGGALTGELSLTIEDAGQPFQSPRLEIVWRCSNCGCGVHRGLPSSQEELEQQLHRIATTY